jgi:hypothetical protein
MGQCGQCATANRTFMAFMATRFLYLTRPGVYASGSIPSSPPKTISADHTRRSTSWCTAIQQYWFNRNYLSNRRAT